MAEKQAVPRSVLRAGHKNKLKNVRQKNAHLAAAFAHYLPTTNATEGSLVSPPMAISRQAPNPTINNIWDEQTMLLSDSRIFPAENDGKVPLFSRFQGTIDRILFHKPEPVDIKSAKSFATGAADLVSPPMSEQLKAPENSIMSSQIAQELNPPSLDMVPPPDVKDQPERKPEMDAAAQAAWLAPTYASQQAGLVVARMAGVGIVVNTSMTVLDNIVPEESEGGVRSFLNKFFQFEKDITMLEAEKRALEMAKEEERRKKRKEAYDESIFKRDI